MDKRLGLIFLIFVFLLSGCQAASRTEAPAMESIGISGAPMEAPLMPEAEYAKSADYANSTADAVAPTVERLVIKNANLSIVVADPAKVVKEIGAMAERMGGFVVNSNVYQNSTNTGVKYTEANILVRVPAEQLTAAMDEIKAKVKNAETDVTNESVTGQDVTSEYTDLSSRLRNLEDTAAQLRKIMEEASKTEDVLSVFNELQRVNGEIEVIKGQMKYYEESAAMSAISVYIQAEEAIAPISVGGWKPQGVARDAVQALIDAYQVIASGAIWAVIFCLPILLPIGLVVFFIVKGVQRARRNRKKAVASEPKGNE